MNSLNKYTGINTENTENAEEGNSVNSVFPVFNPSYDADGNATQVQTSTGTWAVEYNAENRPVRWTNAATGTVITMSFDSQGRRTEYKSVTNGAQNTWLRFLYDGYLCVQVLYSNEPYNVFKEFVWDPTEPDASRPLVFRYAPNSLNLFYAFDGNKNVSDVFYRLTSNGIGAHYDYAPFGTTTRTLRDSSASFDIVALNPFRFSSEHYDSELDLVYYNYRHYSPSLGRFLSRDPIEEQGGWNLYAISMNNMVSVIDLLGLEWFPGTSPWVRYECCGGKKYSTFSSCCISSAGKQTIHSRKEKNYTGVSYYVQRTRWYYFPIYRPWSISQFFLEHAWFNIDNGAWRAGSYPKWDFPSGVYIGEEKYALEEGSVLTFKKDIYLSVCEYDVEKFSQCVKDKAGEGNNWHLWNNCLDWVYDTINACKKELKRK